MCGILGLFNVEDASAKAKQALKVVKNRGRDRYGIADALDYDYKLKIDHLKLHSKESTSVIGHCLHSIVSFLPQPLVNEKTKNRGVVNCEIYNWKELNEKYRLGAKNDADLLFRLIEKKGKTSTQLISLLEEIDGVYAFAFWNVKQNKVYVARDIIGEKPVCFSTSSRPHSQGSAFAFSSEGKALREIGFSDVQELNPRKLLVYDIKNKRLRCFNRPFFKLTPLNNKPYDQIKKETLGLLTNAISKRIPDQEIGILFSGGIDSMFLASMCKKLGLRPKLYTSVLDSKNSSLRAPPDLEWAKKGAKLLGLKLNICKIKLEDVESNIKKIVPLIEDSNVVKVGVALTFYGACEMAAEDGVKVLFSGLGSEEIFAGYERHKKSTDINKECLSGLLKIYERDLYRDDIITMNHALELRLPYLDTKLVAYALKIPEQYKLSGNGDKQRSKIILRDIAKEVGIPEEFAERRKRAAQYGSNFDRAIEKLAKQKKFSTKSEYLNTFLDRKIMKLGVLFSSGKDSHYAMHIMQKQNYEIAGLITLKSKNKDSYMFHTPNIELAKMQAECLGIPLVEQQTSGEKEKELRDLEKALKQAKEEFLIKGVVTGAIFSNYQRERVERVCDKLGLKIFSPLWHMDQEHEIRALVKEGYEVLISSIAADGFDKTWLGRRIGDKAINELTKLNEKFKINVAGEGGEYESLVLDMPMYKKKIKILDSEIIMDNECTGWFVVKKAELIVKKAVTVEK